MTQYHDNDRNTSKISTHFRKSSATFISPHLEDLGNRRSDLLMRKRKLSLHQTSKENFALFERINSQKSVINFSG